MSRDKFITAKDNLNDGEVFPIGPLTQEEFDHVWKVMDEDEHHGAKAYDLSANNNMSYEDWVSCFVE